MNMNRLNIFQLVPDLLRVFEMNLTECRMVTTLKDVKLMVLMRELLFVLALEKGGSMGYYSVF